MIKKDESGHDTLINSWRVEDIIGVLENIDGLQFNENFTIKDCEEILKLADKLSPDVTWETIQETCENYARDYLEK